jgi:hypothetical protein
MLCGFVCANFSCSTPIRAASRRAASSSSSPT